MKNRWMLKAPVLRNFLQDAVASSIKANAEFQSKAGMTPKIIRETDGNCCKWCSEVAGTYEYPNDVPDDVYRRHKNCTCTLIFKPQKGGYRYQDPWSKKESNEHTKVVSEQREHLAKLDKMSQEERRNVRNATARKRRRSKYTEEEWRDRVALRDHIMEMEARAKEIQNDPKTLERRKTIGLTETGREELERRKYLGLAADTGDDIIKAESLSIYFNSTEEIFKYAKKVIATEGYEDVFIHGDKTGFAIRDKDGNESHYTVREFAEILKEDPNYRGGNIKLYSCDTASEGATAAQSLANLLGVDVLAPTDILWIDFEGNVTIGPSALENTGRWVKLTPK